MGRRGRPVNEERRVEILEVAQRSVSYSEAGRKLGICRERVRQVAGPFVKRELEGFESLTELGRRYGYSRSHFQQLALAGSIPTRKIAGMWYVETGLELDFGSCALCRKPLEKGRSRYCSKECAIEADRQSHARGMWRGLRRLKGQKVETDALKLRGHESLRLLRVES